MYQIVVVGIRSVLVCFSRNMSSCRLQVSNYLKDSVIISRWNQEGSIFLCHYLLTISL